MILSPIDPATEQARLDALDRYDILDTPQEEVFDRLTRLTQRMFSVSISTLAFVDAHRQWFKSRQGLSLSQTERRPAFCDRTIREGKILVVPDTHLDDRFRDNPLVLGEPRIRFYAGMPLRTPSGEVLGTLCAIDQRPRGFGPEDERSLADIAAIAETMLALRLHVATDVLTGAMSRRAFRNHAEQVLALARRHGHDLGCIVLDLDHFKSVNDRHGHAVGDAVLRAAVEACRSELRESDIIGRIGGEEFAVLLPLTGEAGAQQVAERLRAAIARVRVPTPTGAVSATASFGIALLDLSVQSVDTLLARADKALYAAKAGGRNRCVLSPAGSAAEEDVGQRRVLKAGLISDDAGGPTIDCTIRHLSDGKAGLDVASSCGLPDLFRLRIGADDTFRSCHVVTKREQHLEVRFN